MWAVSGFSPAHVSIWVHGMSPGNASTITPAVLPAPYRFSSGGAMGLALWDFDWSATPLGEPAGWPQPLKTLVGVLLAADQPMFLAWGPEKTLLYNDAYAPLLADRHPGALGRPFMAVWSEVEAELTPLFAQVFAGTPVHMSDIELQLDRPGRPREAHFAFSYTPVQDEAGNVVGLFCPCTETTNQILAERRRAIEARRQQALLQQMPGFVAVLTGPSHVFDYVNDAYVTISGERALLGLTIRRAFPELEGQGYYELLDQVYATGEPFVARALPISLSGEPRARFIDLLFQPIRDEEGHVTGIFVGGYDITERVRAEQRRETLLQLEERLRDLADTAELSFIASELLGRSLGAARVGYGTVDPDNRTVTVERDWSAPGFGSVAGSHKFEAFGVYIDDLCRGETVANADVRFDPRTVANFASFDALGIAACLDVPVMEQGRLTSEVFVHSATPRTWTDEEIGLVREVADRTRAAIARREAEDERRRGEERLRELNADLERQVAERTHVRGRSWAVTPDLMGALNGQGYFETSNPAWQTMLGWTEEEVRRTSIWEFLHPDDLERTRAGFGLTDVGEPAVQVRNRYRCNDGSYRWISWVAVPENGTVYCTGRDITAEKQREAELEAAQDALRQSQKMEAVGQLTGGIAHDFNNLLAGISGSLELITTRLAQGRTAEVARYVGAAKDAATRAASLTHRLLAFSRRQTLAPKPTDVKQLVAGMADLIARTVGPHIRLETVNGVGLWHSLIDPSQLENTILNLCINARDAMPDGGAITVETANRWIDRRMARERGLAPGQYISLCVSDTGTGMTPDVIAKAFDPFFTTKPIGVGTGLGLSMIYGFAKQSEGAVSIYSELGQGTTVCIYLPRHAGEAEPTDASAEREEPPRGEGETVLVVDDEPTVRMLVTEVLADLGYMAIEAEDGAAGLRTLNSTARIDLLVTDVGLPGGMNGRQLADAARIGRPGLKVLFITGYAENAVLSHGHLDPGMHVMTKPFTMDALAIRIKELIAVEDHANFS